jgi:peptide/nickel transport system permease protein
MGKRSYLISLPILRRLAVRPAALVGFGLIGLLCMVVIVGLVWTPYDPIAIDLDHTLSAPDARHWLGSDQFGRDVLSRAMLGARISLLLGAIVVAIDVSLGLVLGVAAGFFGGVVDRVLMALGDTILAFPGMLLALGLISVLGGGYGSLIIALSIAYLPSVTRVARATALSVRSRDYIDASRLAGDSAVFTLYRHVLPNTLPSVIVLATSLFGWVILSESALSFLGVGVPAPTPSWGNMLADARPYMTLAPWLSLAPGICISLSLLGVNLAGDALRDLIDPRGDDA